LYCEVEGSFIENVGYILAITKVITETDKLVGRISDEDGSVMYRLEFNALVFKPFKYEVVDAIVQKVFHSEMYGIECAIGPYVIFIAQINMGEEYKYDDDTISFTCPDGRQIKEGSKIRCRLLNAGFPPKMTGRGEFNAYCGLLE